MVGVADHVRAAETRRDAVTRAERQAKAALDEVEAESTAAAVERRVVGERVATMAVEVDALKTSDAYKSGVALADVREHARGQRESAARLAAAAVDRATHRDRAAAEVGEAGVEQDDAAANLSLAEGDLRHAAVPAGAEGVVEEAAIAGADDGERLVQAWVDARRRRVGEVRAALDAHTRAVDARTLREDQVAGDEAAVDDRSTAAAQARSAEAAAVTAYGAAVQGWAARCGTIGAERVLSVLPRSAGEPVAVTQAVAALSADLGSEDAVARSVLDADRSVAVAERAALVEERARWSGGGLVDPDGPAWRSPRADLSGAPLWRLVDVAPGMEPAAVDRLEAALIGAGLLDAWVQPDGTARLGDARADVMLAPRRCAGRSLAEVLVPVPPAGDDPGVPAGVVAAVLASVPVATTALGLDSDSTASPAGNPDVVVGLDGTYRLGAATGRGPHRPAEWLGAVARERRRLVRLSEIDAALARVDVALADLDRREAGLDRRRAAVAAELDAVPSGTPVDQSRRVLADAEARLAEAETRLAAPASP